MFVRVSGRRSWLKTLQWKSNQIQLVYQWHIYSHVTTNEAFTYYMRLIRSKAESVGCFSEQGNDHSQMDVELHLHFTCVGNGEESSVWTVQIQLLPQISLVYRQSHVYVGQKSGLHKQQNCKHFSENSVWNACKDLLRRSINKIHQ